MPDSKREQKHDSRNGAPSSNGGGRMPNARGKREVIDEASRLAHEIGVRASAVLSSPHPLLALEQLEAELETACHLARDVRRLINDQVEHPQK
jgi:hypothetical protein